MLPVSFQKGEITFTDKKWLWSYQDHDKGLHEDKPRFAQRLPNGEIIEYNCNSIQTDSNEVTIGELYFGDHVNGPVITGAGFNGTHASDTLTGVRSITAGTVVPTDFSHKIPVKIENADGNVETYYLLLTRNTDNTSTLP